MPHTDPERRKAYKRDWYRRTFNVTNTRQPHDGRSFDPHYSRDLWRKHRIAAVGYVNVRPPDRSPAGILGFRSCYTGDCIVWTGAANRLGYGHLWFNGRFVMAHRLSYELACGPLQDGTEIDHLCKNPPCINPAHLEAVTHLVNVRRGRSADVTRKRHAARTHCKRGHEFSPSNTGISLWHGMRMRYCKICRRMYERGN